jgi:multicomponent K+:H+ antiporter subunit E
MIKRWLPAPWLSLALVALWLLLARSVSAGQIIWALLIGWVMPLWFAPLRPERPHLHKPLVLLRLMGRVAVDGLVSNGQVLRSLLWRPSQPRRAGFVQVPLDLRDHTALTCLCIIATAVPGTVWCEMAPDGSVVVIHVWDLVDEAAFIADFKQRYERPLMDIFE